MKYICLIFILCIQFLTACNNQTKPAKHDSTAVGTPTASQNQQLQQTVSCLEVAYQVLTTSNRFKELTKGLYNAVVKNGGTSYGLDLEGSPNPKQDSAMDYSKTYDFSLHETYTDRDVVTARFAFSMAAKQLYEYDITQDSLMPIDFDKTLLPKLNSVCK